MQRAVESAGQCGASWRGLRGGEARAGENPGPGPNRQWFREGQRRGERQITRYL